MVSIIILSYNFENYIENTIISALFQNTTFDYEIIVVDDDSTDRTYKILDKLSFLSKKIILSKNKKNLGVHENLKGAIKLCSGKYIAFLDGDDYWIDRDKLEKQVEFMENNQDYSMCFTGYIRDNFGDYWPSENGLWLGLVGYENNEVKTNDLLNLNPICTSTTLFRNHKDIMKPYFSEIKFLDWAMNFEASRIGKIKYLDFPSVMYRYHGNGLSSSMGIEEKNEQIERTKNFFKTQCND
jgi:glycosyltransferase involved in cell wall biosynthesis